MLNIRLKRFTSSRMSSIKDNLLPKTVDANYLERLNSHPLDSNVSFDVEKHVYQFCGENMKISVSQLVDSFLPKFDEDRAIYLMMNSKRWPRDGYLHKCGTPFSILEIKDKWASIGLDARKKGTRLHYLIENFLNNVTLSDNEESPLEFDQFLRFYKNFIVRMDWQPFRTEWKIAAPDIGVAGTVDCVTMKPDGTFAIVDWKRAKKIDDSHGVPGANFPISHLKGNTAVRYSLQVNLYRYILEKYYQLNVTSMMVVSFHPHEPTYDILTAPDLRNEVLAMLQVFSQRNDP